MITFLFQATLSARNYLNRTMVIPVKGSVMQGIKETLPGAIEIGFLAANSANRKRFLPFFGDVFERYDSQTNSGH